MTDRHVLNRQRSNGCDKFEPATGVACCEDCWCTAEAEEERAHAALPPDWENAVEMIRAAGYVHPAECLETMAADLIRLRVRIAAALAALRTAPDLDTAEPSRAVLRRAHTAILAAWAELADEPASGRAGGEGEETPHG